MSTSSVWMSEGEQKLDVEGKGDVMLTDQAGCFEWGRDVPWALVLSISVISKWYIWAYLRPRGRRVESRKVKGITISSYTNSLCLLKAAQLLRGWNEDGN